MQEGLGEVLGLSQPTAASTPVRRFALAAALLAPDLRLHYSEFNTANLGHRGFSEGLSPGQALGGMFPICSTNQMVRRMPTNQELRRIAAIFLAMNAREASLRNATWGFKYWFGLFFS
jgi:hypothetical protein